MQGKKMLYNRGQGTTWDGSARGRYRGKYCKGKGQRGECCKGEAKSGKEGEGRDRGRKERVNMKGKAKRGVRMTDEDRRGEVKRKEGFREGTGGG